MLLGKLLGDRGDLAGARLRLETATRDPDPKVAGAARAALDRLTPRPPADR